LVVSLFIGNHVAAVAVEDVVRTPDAGGAQKRGDVQRNLGELRYVDERASQGGDLYVQRRR